MILGILSIFSLLLVEPPNELNMIVRNIQPSDFLSLFELGTQLFRPEDEVPELKKALDVCFLELSYVAVENGCILGFTVVCPLLTTISDGTIPPNGSVELAFFGVSPACQGRGIGSRLLKETLHTLFQRSYSSVWLLVNVSNKSAVHMYEHRGFQRWKQIWPVGASEACWIMGMIWKPCAQVYHPLITKDSVALLPYLAA